jgi:hypothetical protein
MDLESVSPSELQTVEGGFASGAWLAAIGQGQQEDAAAVTAAREAAAQALANFITSAFAAASGVQLTST